MNVVDLLTVCAHNILLPSIGCDKSFSPCCSIQQQKPPIDGIHFIRCHLNKTDFVFKWIYSAARLFNQIRIHRARMPRSMLVRVCHRYTFRLNRKIKIQFSSFRRNFDWKLELYWLIVQMGSVHFICSLFRYSPFSLHFLSLSLPLCLSVRSLLGLFTFRLSSSCAPTKWKKTSIIVRGRIKTKYITFQPQPIERVDGNRQ